MSSSLLSNDLIAVLHSDVTFIVEDRPIYAHRAILAQRCDHFAAMFRSGMRESTEREVRIQGASYTTFLLVLKYLYTDSLKVDPEYAIEMYMIADLYRLDRLKDMCSRVAKRSLTCEVCRLYLSCLSLTLMSTWNIKFSSFVTECCSNA